MILIVLLNSVQKNILVKEEKVRANLTAIEAAMIVKILALDQVLDLVLDQGLDLDLVVLNPDQVLALSLDQALTLNPDQDLDQDLNQALASALNQALAPSQVLDQVPVLVQLQEHLLVITKNQENLVRKL